MNTSVQAVTTVGLVYAFIPAAVVVVILFRWCATGWSAIYALTRMLIQLLLVGFVLVYIFAAENAWIILAVLAVMMLAASWISIRPVREKTPAMYRNAGIAVLLGGGLTLLLVSQLVLSLQPWYLPRYVIPLAGMIFAGSMNAISLAAERYEAERQRAVTDSEARAIALQASLIPMTNALLAVGLVSLPGMMTGQILSGVSPFIAAKYQIIVMCMMYGSSGMSAAIYLTLSKRAVAGAPSRRD
ncbi:MAG: ABC transporter permease [Gammaproteobacteria bacterium]|nr:ABC transporter permease [Gammaproteobacteria bacterium]